MFGVRRGNRLAKLAFTVLVASAGVSGSALVAGAAALTYPEPHYGSNSPTGTVAIEGGPTFPISYFAQSVSLAQASQSSTTPSKVVIEPIIVTKSIDEATPFLFKAAATAGRISKVTMTVQPQSSQAPPVSYVLEDVRVTEDQEVPLGSTTTYSGPAGAALPAVEIVAFAPARVTVRVGNNVSGYDFATARPL